MVMRYTPSVLVIFFAAFIFLCLDVQLYKQIQNESRFNITITVKAVMLDHLNSYIFQPTCDYFIEVTRLPALLPRLTANHISYLGVVFAVIAARLGLSDTLQIRRFGVIAFLGRQFMDDLDGLIARFHNGIDVKTQVSLPQTSGYYVDGICDGIGFIVFWFCIFLQNYGKSTLKSKITSKSTNYKMLSIDQQTGLFGRKTVLYYLYILFIMGLSSLSWNLYIVKYHDLVDPLKRHRTPLQEEIFKSSLMFTIMWLWRCLNPHAMTNYFLASIWLNRTTRYAKKCFPYFFWAIIATSFLCEVHLQDIKYRLER